MTCSLSIKTRLIEHFNERSAGSIIDTIVIHSMFAPPPAESMIDPLFCIQALDSCQVSAHYLITREGEIWKLVEEEHRAWHAGTSKIPEEWKTETAVNDISIGIELIAPENTGFEEEQYQSLAILCTELCTRHPIRYILGHEDVAIPPGRKSDPGPLFDWSHYRSLLTTLAPSAKNLLFPLDLSS